MPRDEKMLGSGSSDCSTTIVIAMEVGMFKFEIGTGTKGSECDVGAISYVPVS